MAHQSNLTTTSSAAATTTVLPPYTASQSSSDTTTPPTTPPTTSNIELSQQSKFKVTYTQKASHPRQWRSDLCMYTQLCNAEQYVRDQAALRQQLRLSREAEMVGVEEEIHSLKHLAVEACRYNERISSTSLLDFLMTKNTCKNLVQVATTEEGREDVPGSVAVLDRTVGNVPTMFVSRLLHDVGVIFLTVLAQQRSAYYAAAGLEREDALSDEETTPSKILDIDDRVLIAESKRLTLKSLRELPLWGH